MTEKFAIVNNNFPNTGTGRYAFKLWEIIKKKNVDVDFIFINKLKYTLEKFDSSNRITTIAKTNRIPLIDNKTCLYYRLSKKIPRYSLYHITTQNLSFLKLYPRIITVHDIIHYVFPETKIHYFLSKHVLYRGLRTCTNTFFITISNFTKRDLIKYFKIPEDKVKVIYLGVDHEIYKPLPYNEINKIKQKYNLTSPFILYVGSDHPRKNISTLVKSIYKLKKKYKLDNVKLVKVGAERHRYRKHIINLIKGLNLEKNIIFIDNVPEKDLAGLYNAADLFVYPSLYEGFGLPPLEAMACGTPVITSTTTSLPEVVGNAGIMIDPYDVDGLAKAMYEVLTNDGLREELRKKGLKRAKLFSWRKTAKETLKVYEEVYSIIK